MEEPIEYFGKVRAYLNSISRPLSITDTTPTIKWDISFKSLENLEMLLRITPGNNITIGDEEMDYDRFRKEILGKTHRIYISIDSRMFDQIESRA